LEVHSIEGNIMVYLLLASIVCWVIQKFLQDNVIGCHFNFCFFYKHI